jgi:hypothetical protein
VNFVAPHLLPRARRPHRAAALAAAVWHALTVSEAFHSVFRPLPSAPHAREQTALLLEMPADDRALRCHSGEVP